MWITPSKSSRLTARFLLSLLMLAWLLAGCGSQPEPTPVPVAVEPPTISEPQISAPTPQEPGQEVGIAIDVTSASGVALAYEWSADGGEIVRGDGSPAITYRTPQEPGIYNVRVTVKWDTSSVEKVTTIRVEAPVTDTPTPEPPTDTPAPESDTPTTTSPPPTFTQEPTATSAPPTATLAPTNTAVPEEPAASETTFERAKRTGVIRVGFANEQPYGFANADGTLSGESIEIARLIFDRLGIPEIEGVKTEFATLISDLQADQFDVITAGMWINPERCKQVLFANPQYKSIVEDQSNPMYGAIAFKKEDVDLHNAFNTELQKLKDSGELEAIINQFDGYVGETSLPGNVTAEEICNPDVVEAPQLPPQVLFVRPSCGSEYTVEANRPIELYYGAWGAQGQELVEQNSDNLTVSLRVDGQKVEGVRQPAIPMSDIPCGDVYDGYYWVVYKTVLDPLTPRQHVIEDNLVTNAQINDGGNTYEAGESFPATFTVIAK